MSDQVAPGGTYPGSGPASRTNKIFGIGLIGLLGILALTFGGVEPFGHLVLIIGAAALGILLAVRVWLRPNLGVVWSWTYLPLFGFVALVGLQAFPMSRDLLKSIAPPNHRLWVEMLDDPASAADATRNLSVSLYPHETEVDLRLMIAGALIFFGVVNVYRSRRAVRNLLLGTSIVGATVLALSALQHLTDSSALLWTWEMPGRARCGPFLHYGHFSQFINLTISGAIALLLMRVVGAGRLDPSRAREWFQDLRFSSRPLDLFLLALLIIGPALIIISRSRNGVISMCVGGFVLGLIMHRTRLVPGSGWPLAVFATLAFLMVLLIGFDPIFERFSEESPDEAYAGRLALLADSLRGFREFPLLGIGHGAFRVVFPMFDTSLRIGTAGHAENQFVELLFETGIVGFALVAVFLIMIAAAWWRGLRRHESERRTASIGLTFGVVAVLFHALTDFGMRVPAIAILMTIFLGVIVGVAARPATFGLVSRGLATILCLGSSGFLLASVPDTYDSYRANQHWLAMKTLEGELSQVGYAAEKEELDALLNQAEAAVGWQPNNIFHRFWYYQHMWHRATAGRGYERVRKDPESVVLAQKIQAAMLRSREVAPTFGPLWSVIGQLGVKFLDDPDAARFVIRGQELAPHDPGTCLASGWQHLRDGREDDAVESLKRAVYLTKSPITVITVLLDVHDRLDLAHRVLDHHPRHLLRLWHYAKTKYAAESPTAVAVEASFRTRQPALDAIRTDAIHQIERRIEKNAALSWMFIEAGKYYLEAKQYAQAEKHLREYLRRDPGSGYRQLLAESLYRQGNREAALDELRTLLRRHPASAASNPLLREIMAAGK